MLTLMNCTNYVEMCRWLDRRRINRFQGKVGKTAAFQFYRYEDFQKFTEKFDLSEHNCQILHEDEWMIPNND